MSAASNAWTFRRGELAAWVLDHLVNRDDRFGGYGDRGTLTKPTNGLRAGVVNEALLLAHFRDGCRAAIVGLHAGGPDQTARWLGLDFDDHGDGSLGPANFEAAVLCRDLLAADGFTSLLEDSNGAGGLHLWAVFADAVALRDLHHYAAQLAERCGAAGLPVPEANPKQGFIPAGGFGNWLRLPGRHHSRPHWSRFYVDGQWLDGDDAIEAMLGLRLCDPIRLPVAPEPQRPIRSNGSSNPAVWCRGRVVDFRPSLVSRASAAAGLEITFRVDEQHDGIAWQPFQPIDVTAAVWVLKRDGTCNGKALDRLDATFGTRGGGIDALLAGTLDIHAWPSAQVRVEQSRVYGPRRLAATAFRHADHPFEAETWLRKADRRGVGEDRTRQGLNYAKFLAFDVGLSEAAVWHWLNQWNEHHLLTPLEADRLDQTFTNAISKQYGVRKAHPGVAI